MSEFRHLVDLASERLGGTALFANDDFFAPKENLLKPSKPVWIEDKYTVRGKWMDGWESRRRRTPGHDWCLIKLGLPGIVHGIVVDTSYFRGNFPSHCSLEACAVPGDPSAEQLLSVDTDWHEILPKAELRGDSQNGFAVQAPWRFTHLRFNIYPDGGVARLRVYGEVMPDWPAILSANKEIDLAAVEHGGQVLGASDLFFSHPLNLLMPGRGARMDDGWETKRRRGPGNDWCVLKLGIGGEIQRVIVDTAHFKGNFPESCSIECWNASTLPFEPRTPDDFAPLPWKVLLPRVPLTANAEHTFCRMQQLQHPPSENSLMINDCGAVTHVRLSIYPDGGVSRLRLFGTPSREGRLAAGLAWLNALTEREAAAAILDCCGCPEWAKQIAEARPYRDAQGLYQAAESATSALSREQWLVAFASHPRIGEKRTGAQSEQANRWSAREQATVHASGAAEELASANREYESRFGHTFIVCASGKSAGEILALLRERMKNNAAKEFEVACGEQQKIARLRLERLVQL